MTIGKAEICKQLEHALANKLSKADAKLVIDTYFETVCMALEQNEQVTLTGLGQFRIRNKQARPGRNPKTKEDHTISARRVVTLQPSTKLRKKVLEPARLFNNADIA